jgi:hypothetical protein
VKSGKSLVRKAASLRFFCHAAQNFSENTSERLELTSQKMRTQGRPKKETKVVMKIERSCRIQADATIMRRALRRIICSLFLVAAVTAVASPRANQRLEGVSTALPANIIVVANTNDSGAGSLRGALALAKDGDTIDATGVSGTILLISGELQITHSVSINGPGTASLTVSGNATFRVFENFASNVIISGLTITNGFAADNNGGGGILNHGVLTLSDSIVNNCATPSGNNQQGGGIFNDAGAILTLTGSTLTGNHAGCAGGGVYSTNAQLTVTNSTISGNGAGSLLPCLGTGGGISINGGSLTVTNSTISGNGGGLGGGGMSGDDVTVTVSNSTISGNTGACFGGGISISNVQLTVISSTISGNLSGGFAGLCEAGVGGGIYSGNAQVTVTNSTLSGNSASGNGGGIDCGGGTLTVTHSTISDNEGGGISNVNGQATQIGDTVLNAGEFGGTISNNGGTVTSLGYNFASDDGGGVLTGPGDQINTDPILGPLQDNGGPTFTHELLLGSPAIDAGDPSFTPSPDYDQRGPGFARVVNSRIDIGSFEVQGLSPTPTPTPTATATPTSTPRHSPTSRPRQTPHPRPSR